eukprot:8751644-Ditylum_brightwellii.AAC.1
MDIPCDLSNKKRRRLKRRFFGQVCYSVGNNKYMITWDDGSQGNYSTNTLRYKGDGQSLLNRGSHLANRRVLENEITITPTADASIVSPSALPVTTENASVSSTHIAGGDTVAEL